MSKKRSKKQILTVMIIPILLLSGCGMASELFLEETPTHSLKATLAPTATLKPTPMILSGFIGSIEGIGEHGNMICVVYEGDEQELSNLSLFVNIFQEDILIETNIEAENILERLCFEMVDAKYIVNKPVSIEIIAVKGDLEIRNNNQVLEIGIYELSSFLNWFFGEGGIGGKVSLPSKSHEDAYDFAPKSSDKYPNGEGHPVYFPSNGILITTERGPKNNPDIHNIFIFLPDVGFYIQIGHTEWIFSPNENKEYGSNTVIGYLNNETGWPHVHTTLRIPPSWDRIYYEGELKKYDSFIDILNPEIQIGGDHLPCGLFICSTLPEIFVDKLETGFFKPRYNQLEGQVIRLY